MLSAQNVFEPRNVFRARFQAIEPLLWNHRSKFTAFICFQLVCRVHHAFIHEYSWTFSRIIGVEVFIFKYLVSFCPAVLCFFTRTGGKICHMSCKCVLLHLLKIYFLCCRFLMQVPWKSLGKEPVIVLIDRVFVLAHPAPNGYNIKARFYEDCYLIVQESLPFFCGLEMILFFVILINFRKKTGKSFLKPNFDKLRYISCDWSNLFSVCVKFVQDLHLICIQCYVLNNLFLKNTVISICYLHILDIQ